jgi:hypothetical protein
MADTTTTNLGLTKPEVGASSDTWGGKINTNLDLVDGIFAAAGSGTSVGLNVGTGKTLTVGGTQNMSALTASTALALDSSKNIVSVTNTGTGNNVLSASPTLTGTISAAAQTLSGNLTLSGGTINGVAYLNGSKVLTSGTALVFDGTNLSATRGLKAASAGIAVSSFVDGLNVGGYDSIGFLASPGNALAIGGYRAAQWSGLEFYASGALQATLNSTGLGIGTASPSYKLDVAGDARSNSWIGRANGSAPTADCAVFRPADNSLGFSTANTLRATIDSSGNLGLGVTPSAWSGGGVARAIQIGNYGAGLFSNAGGDTLSTLTHGAYFDGTNWKYLATSVGAGRYQITGANAGSVHSWSTSAGGTAGNAITFTQAMTLDASGRLLVGRTTNFAGEALQIDANGVGATVYSALIGNSSTSTSVYNVLRFNQGASGSATGYIGTGGSAVGNNAFANNFVVGTQTSNALVFTTNDTERARITSGGDLLVAKTSASFTTVGAEMRANGQVNSAGTADFWNAYSTTGSAYRFYVTNAGTVFATNTTISAISDKRFKENIQDLDVGLDAILALKPRKFDWKEGKGKDIKGDRGFIAQEFEQIFPDLVDEWRDPAPEGEEPYKSVRQDLIPVLVKAIQEQQAMIKSLEAKVAALEAK